jgi:hypothetical protein
MLHSYILYNRFLATSINYVLSVINYYPRVFMNSNTGACTINVFIVASVAIL